MPQYGGSFSGASSGVPDVGYNVQAGAGSDPGAFLSGIFTSTGQAQSREMLYNSAEAAKEYQRNAALQERSFEMQKELNSDAYAFQKELRDTQYESYAKQLEKAGINPILAYTGSLGSSGSAATGSAPQASTSSARANLSGGLRAGDLVRSFASAAMAIGQLSMLSMNAGVSEARAAYYLSRVKK